MMLKTIQKSLDMIGLQQGNPIRSFLRQVALFIWSSLLHYPRLIKVHFVQKHYKNVLKKLHEKASINEKIVVGYYIVNDSSFSFRPLFERMLQDVFFDPYLVIIPDTLRGKENEIARAKQTYESLVQKYGSERVILGYNYQNDSYSDPSDQFDIIAFTNPYENMTHKYFTMKYICRKNVLTLYTSYGYSISNQVFIHHVAPSLFIACLWRVYATCQHEFDIFRKYSLYRAKNVILTGNMKMDMFNKKVFDISGRTTIIIAPHHTIGKTWDSVFALSNFLEYYDFILRLPELYPQIDFVFRPHPLLFTNLINQNIWTKQQVDDYLHKITSFSNARYSIEGDYSQLFAESDALIHDCGSYMSEYYFTDKPQCFVVKSDVVIKKHLNELGQECVSHAYLAYSEQDIVNFIESVVISKKDIKYEERHKFWEQNLKCNYPEVTESVINTIKSNLSRNID